MISCPSNVNSLSVYMYIRVEQKRTEDGRLIFLAYEERGRGVDWTVGEGCRRWRVKKNNLRLTFKVLHDIQELIVYVWMR